MTILQVNNIIPLLLVMMMVAAPGYHNNNIMVSAFHSYSPFSYSISHHSHAQMVMKNCNERSEDFWIHRIGNTNALKKRMLITSVAATSEGINEDDDDDDDDEDDNDDGEVENSFGVSKKRMVEVTSQIELPFSAEVAYDAYSDLTRQPTWSSWLSSVEYLDESKQISKWTISFMGISYSWTAEAVKYERPHTIQWKSTSGLRNFGTVKFYPMSGNERTLMDVNISLVAPRAASAVLRRSNKLTNFVRDKMVASSLLEFREIVLQNDLNRKD